MAMKTLLILTGDLQENCYLLWRAGAPEGLVFDPGGEAEKIAAALKKSGLQPAAFLLTHCHFDHIGALTPLKQLFPAAPIYVPALEEQWLQRPALNLSYFMGGSITAPAADRLVKPEDKIAVAGFALRCIHVPGHSPGSTVYLVEAPGGTPHIFAGDTLMRGSIGRGDLPGGAGEAALAAEIRAKLFTLPDETIVHPGHGEETTIGEEKRSNPFCGPSGF